MLSQDMRIQKKEKSLQEETQKKSTELAKKVDHLKSVKFDEEALKEAEILTKQLRLLSLQRLLDRENAREQQFSEVSGLMEKVSNKIEKHQMAKD